MATDMAAESDSTVRNSAFRVSCFTIADTASTMWVCGVIGYAQTTSGRHIATASATARDPSICTGMRQLPALVEDPAKSAPRGRDVRFSRTSLEAVSDRDVDGVDRDRAAQGGEPAEQRAVRD